MKHIQRPKDLRRQANRHGGLSCCPAPMPSSSEGTGLFYIRPHCCGQDLPVLTSRTRAMGCCNPPHSGKEDMVGGNREQRKPMLLLVFVGLFLLRLAERTLLSLLFHAPPRNTPTGIPANQAQAWNCRQISGMVFSQPPSNFPISTSDCAAK